MRGSLKGNRLTFSINMFEAWSHLFPLLDLQTTLQQPENASANA